MKYFQRSNRVTTVFLLGTLCGLFFGTWCALADESLDFDVDQLIATEKAWAANSPSSVTSAPRRIRVTLMGIRNESGVIHILAYDDETAFRFGDHTSAVGYLKSDAKRGKQTFTLDVVTIEKIALFAYHDENRDEILNKRGQIPTEAYGFSGGVNPYTQPSFEQACFDGDEITVRLMSVPRR